MSDTTTTSAAYEFKYKTKFSQNIINHYQALEKQVGNYADNEIIKDINETLRTAATNFISDDVLNAYNQTPYRINKEQEKPEEVSSAYLATKTLLHISYLLIHSVSNFAYIILSFLKLSIEYADNLAYNHTSDASTEPHIIQINKDHTPSGILFTNDIAKAWNNGSEQVNIHSQQAYDTGKALLNSIQKQPNA